MRRTLEVRLCGPRDVLRTATADPEKIRLINPYVSLVSLYKIIECVSLNIQPKCWDQARLGRNSASTVASTCPGPRWHAPGTE